MSDYIEVEWDIEDGYVGRPRPHRTIIYLDELDHCETVDDVAHHIIEVVQDDFDNRIQWTFAGDLSEIAERVMSQVEEMRDIMNKVETENES